MDSAEYYVSDAGPRQMGLLIVIRRTDAGSVCHRDPAWLLIPGTPLRPSNPRPIDPATAGPEMMVRRPSASIRARNVEATTGFEPVYAVLQTAPWPSGTSPPMRLAAPRGFDLGSRIQSPLSCQLDDGASRTHRRLAEPVGQRNRAEVGTRTRDPHLGMVMLYQLSLFARFAPSSWCRGSDSRRHPPLRAVLYQRATSARVGRRADTVGSGGRCAASATRSRLRPGPRGPRSARRAAGACPTSSSSAFRTL